ncbi:hypothetical protein CEUSTIGMA_g318.t1 [Chlamydomonas eustigma]|uniref:Apple domain-containing protein n=1 Tax=Chlamydomonas eustigma TaxID=1157962 RepID=A0A250WPW7_9CHLO|nr:hypothetical protein CEUSTIGMA_g318.t1 [Chlamydomonas eustigma]|eukprot:GAX72863.1 hypothetical protein CEUSTIGMA_g318.t1 [Chlamydomonas eustigma]
MVQSSSMGLIMIGLACLYITFQVTSHQRIQAYSKDSKKEDVDTSAIKITEHTDLKIASDMKTSDVNLSKTTGYAEQTGHDICHVEAHNEYHGSVVKWGDNNLLDSPEACCEQCRMTENCNAWVYCNDSAGCGGGAHPRPFKECWLKHAELLDLMEHVIGRGHAGISWASGVLYTEAEYAAVQQQLKEKTEAEDRRRIALRDDPEIPLVRFLTSVIAGKTFWSFVALACLLSQQRDQNI